MLLLLQEGGTMVATGVEAAMGSVSACADRHSGDCAFDPNDATGKTYCTVLCFTLSSH